MGDKVVALVPAAGLGKRMEMKNLKQCLYLGERPVLTQTLFILEKVSFIDSVVVVVPPQNEGKIYDVCIEPYELSKVIAVVSGGLRRQDSIVAGFKVIEKQNFDWVVIHDAVRCLVEQKVFFKVFSAARETGAAIAAIPCYDTLKKVNEHSFIDFTLSRNLIWNAQTPQIFSMEIMKKVVFRNELKECSATDESEIVEKMGYEVRVVLGSKRNLKITDFDDFSLVRDLYLLGKKKKERIGQGIDVHAFRLGKPLILGGLKINHEFGLVGHSDADVIVHAVMDALLAAAGLGDIGSLFPDTDSQYVNVNSLSLLKEVVNLLIIENWIPKQVTVICLAQSPKLENYRNKISSNLANHLKIRSSLVNVAFSTTEELGFVGKKEGIMVLATAVIESYF